VEEVAEKQEAHLKAMPAGWVPGLLIIRSIFGY
jgi:hypothetical protein